MLPGGTSSQRSQELQCHNFHQHLRIGSLIILILAYLHCVLVIKLGPRDCNIRTGIALTLLCLVLDKRGPWCWIPAPRLKPRTDSGAINDWKNEMFTLGNGRCLEIEHQRHLGLWFRGWRGLVSVAYGALEAQSHVCSIIDGYKTGISKAPGSGMFLSQLSSWSILCSDAFLGIMELLMTNCTSDSYCEWTPILPRFLPMEPPTPSFYLRVYPFQHEDGWKDI